MIAKIKNQTIHYNVLGTGLPLIILHGLYLDSISMVRAIENSGVQLKGFKRIYLYGTRYCKKVFESNYWRSFDLSSNYYSS
ncbi:hypothetical protein SAMN02745207_02329 [Clostridium grantii DSM 8605]|uniref:Alpha/beta hydrolase family protein n=1 Tax=Clostridium grantii DSM 8605 TaxID=1121316 RepID=A0A1M5VM12_9CLOT|nr:hypothetical protein SAMN02745207_02329 [Clostridium grantii DSM 8605]